MNNKIISIKQAISYIKNYDTLMVGGFAGKGNPMTLIKEIANSSLKNLTLICNDTGTGEEDVGALISNNVIKIIVSHIGTNPEAIEKVTTGKLKVEFIPQGTLAEKIRCAGVGLGGILVPIEVSYSTGTKRNVIEIDGKLYIFEEPLRGDVAIIKANKSDKMGNLTYHGSTRTHSPLMCMAANITIAEVEEIVENGSLDPNNIHTPFIFVDYIVKGEI